jgi:hypothetical protein
VTRGRKRAYLHRKSICSTAPDHWTLTTNDIEKRADQYEGNEREQIAPRSMKERIMGFGPVIERSVNPIECAGQKCDDDARNRATSDIAGRKQYPRTPVTLGSELFGGEVSKPPTSGRIDQLSDKSADKNRRGGRER